MNTNSSYANYFRSLQILFFALLLGQVVFCGFILLLKQKGGEPAASVVETDSWFQWIAIPSALVIAAGVFIRKKLTDSARTQDGLSAKLMQYRVAQITGWALFEAATLINVLFYFVTGNEKFVYIAGTTLLFFIWHVPMRNRLVNDLDLSSSAQAELEG